MSRPKSFSYENYQALILWVAPSFFLVTGANFELRRAMPARKTEAELDDLVCFEEYGLSIPVKELLPPIALHKSCLFMVQS